MLILKSRINTLQGKLDRGWFLANQALTIATENHYFENISQAYCTLGDVYLTLHMFEEAIVEYKLGSENLLGTHSGLDNYYRMGYALAINGDMEEGLSILRQSISIASQTQLASISIPAQYLYSQLLDKSGNQTEAQSILQSVLCEIKSRNLSFVIIPGSIPRLQYLWDSIENSLAEQVLKNLSESNIIKPGVWIDRLLSSVSNHRYYTKMFDFQRFERFFRSMD